MQPVTSDSAAASAMAPWSVVFINRALADFAAARHTCPDAATCYGRRMLKTTSPDFGDPDVRFVAVAGTREREAALVVHRPAGTTIVLNDLVGNVRDATGLADLMFRLAGFAGREPRIPRVVKRLLVSDAGALRAQLLEWAAIESLRRILVSHGEPIEQNPRQILRTLAQSV